MRDCFPYEDKLSILPWWHHDRGLMYPQFQNDFPIAFKELYQADAVVLM